MSVDNAVFFVYPRTKELDDTITQNEQGFVSQNQQKHAETLKCPKKSKDDQVDDAEKHYTSYREHYLSRTILCSI